MNDVMRSVLGGESSADLMSKHFNVDGKTISNVFEITVTFEKDSGTDIKNVLLEFGKEDDRRTHKIEKNVDDKFESEMIVLCINFCVDKGINFDNVKSISFKDTSNNPHTPIDRYEIKTERNFTLHTHDYKEYEEYFNRLENIFNK